MNLIKFDMWYLKDGVRFSQKVIAKDWKEASFLANHSGLKGAKIVGVIIHSEIDYTEQIKMN